MQTGRGRHLPPLPPPRLQHALTSAARRLSHPPPCSDKDAIFAFSSDAASHIVESYVPIIKKVGLVAPAGRGRFPRRVLIVAGSARSRETRRRACC